ncbi:MAG: hypothetical protein ACE5GD_03420 [Candidatus Geothermarchaeales archaeon]
MFATPLKGLFGFVIIPLLMGWVISALALYLAGRIVAGSKASFWEALLITLVGPILVAVFGSLAFFIFGPFIGLLVTFLAWIWVVKSIFGVGWFSSLLISILTLFTFVLVILLVSFLLGIAFFAFTL